MLPQDRDEFRCALEEILQQILPGILDRHAERRERFVKQAAFYSASDFAERVDRSHEQVLFWLREGQIIGEQPDDALSGAHLRWKVPHAEFVRYRDEGLYPRYSIESFEKALRKKKKDLGVPSLAKRIESWCANQRIRARLCPHGWRILPTEVNRVFALGLL